MKGGWGNNTPRKKNGSGERHQTANKQRQIGKKEADRACFSLVHAKKTGGDAGQSPMLRKKGHSETRGIGDSTNGGKGNSQV